MSLTDDVAAAAEAAQQARIVDLQGQLGQTRKALAEALRRLDTSERVAEASTRALKPPRWMTRRPRKSERVGTLWTVLSDLHLDEVVDPAEVDGRNAYDRAIAEQRLGHYFTGIVKIAQHYLAGLTYDGVVCALAGDLISGDIHEELSETNEGTALETVLFWTERLAAGLGLLADEFGGVHVPVVVGNHGRRSRKPRAKKRARDNFDWLIGQMLARHFAHDERVTFQIPDSTDALVTSYDSMFLVTHGDQVSGGGGIGGIWPPLMRMVARKRTRHEFDTLVCGHWHQLIQAPTAGLIVNGSLKGFDEYAAVSNFVPERAQQALWVVTPEHGTTFQAPVLVEDRKAEGW